MKRVAFVITFALFFCPALQLMPAGPDTVSHPLTKAGASRKALTPPSFPSVKGTVTGIDRMDPQQGIVRPRITITDAQGEKYVFIVNPTTTIYDREWKAIGLEHIKAADSVEIRYRLSKEGFKEAVSIIIQ